MRAVKLIAVSTVAILAGAANLAFAAQAPMQPGKGSMQSGAPVLHGMNKHGMNKHAGGIHSNRTFARATSQEMERLNAQERSHLRDMVRNIPRIANVGTEVRINAVVPQNVKQAAVPLPPKVQQMYPRFRHSRAFIYHDQIVIVHPVTSRILAIVQA